MAFIREENLTKDAIGDFESKLLSHDPLDVEGEDSGLLSVQIKKSDGTIENRRYDLLERLQDDSEGLGHLANLIDLRDYLRSRLEAEVLPL